MRRVWWRGLFVANRKERGFLLILLIALVSASAAQAATGDLVASVTASQNCNSGIGVGVAFDGANLWFSCFQSNPDLMRLNPLTGTVTATYNINSGLGAIAYDSTRNALWAGRGSGTNGSVFFLISLDALKNVTGSVAKFTPPIPNVGLDDGLGYDAQDDTIYTGPDTKTTIYHLNTNGALLDTRPSATGGCSNSGLAIGGQLLFQGSDGCQTVFVTNKVTNTLQFSFSTASSGNRDEGLSCDPVTFASQGKQVMWSKEAFSPNRAAAFEIPPGTCGVGGSSGGGAAACPAHAHGHVSTGSPGHFGALSNPHAHHAQHGTHLAANTCPPHAPSHTAGGAAPPGGTAPSPAPPSATPTQTPLTAQTEEGLSSLAASTDFVAALNQEGKAGPAQRGTVVQLFGSAVGLYLDEQDTQSATEFTPPASGSPLYYTENLPEVRIGGLAAKVLFSGLAPGLKGVWQVNVLVPAEAPVGNLPVSIAYEGQELASVPIEVK